MSEPSYVDDAAFNFHFKPAAVAINLRLAGNIIWRCFVHAGFEVFFSKQKAAAVVRWHGEGATAWKRHLAVECNSVIALTCGNMIAEVNVVESYKHLGAFTASTPSMAKEVNVRSNALRSTAKPYLKKVLWNHKLDISDRMGIVKTLMLSRSSFQINRDLAYPQSLRVWEVQDTGLDVVSKSRRQLRENRGGIPELAHGNGGTGCRGMHAPSSAFAVLSTTYGSKTRHKNRQRCPQVAHCTSFMQKVLGDRG